jgi:CCR4-NOT transcription complex subunit 1
LFRAQRLVDDFRGVRRPPVAQDVLPIKQAAMKPETEQIREKLVYYFSQWVQAFQTGPPEKIFVPFITKMTSQGLLKVEEISSLFFRVCIEAGVAHYMKCVAAGEYEHCFQALDAMARLVALMLKYYGGDASGNNDQAKVKYLTKILSIVVVVLSYLHEEQGPAFQQKPFFRFFASLVTDLHTIEADLGTAYLPLLIGISDAFSSLQPIYFPGFAFSWLCLISHRLFMPKLLLPDNRDVSALFG